MVENGDTKAVTKQAGCNHLRFFF